jgi:apolipoprotein N-acyltransferase
MAGSLRFYLIAALSGLVLALPFRYYDGALPAWVGLAPVLWLVANAGTTRRAVACSAIFSLCWTVPAFSFLWHLAPAGMVALCIYTSLYYVGALMAARWLARRGIVCAVFGTAAVWALVEIVRSRVPVFGFPWLLLGHSLLFNEWLRQSADLFGVYGLSFLIAAVNAWLAFSIVPKALCPTLPMARGARFVTATLGLLIGAALGYGVYRTQSLEPRLRPGPPIALIQGNILTKLGRTAEELIEQVKGHNILHTQALARARESGTEPVLVCWAETMVPGALNTDDVYSKPFREHVAETGVPALAGSNYEIRKGAEALSSDPDSYNAAYVLDGSGKEVFHYFKRRLVPFGEYIPFTTSLPFLKALRSVTRDQYIPGTEPSAVLTVPLGSTDVNPEVRYRIAMSICVEDIHPDIAREGVNAGADTLMNVTNDGWFYETCGPRAHMLSAAWRAIETRRPLLRITNTGHTVAVDPLGRIDTLLEPWTVGTATVRLQRLIGGSGQPATLYLWLGEAGAAMVFFGIFLSAIMSSRWAMQTLSK